LKNSGQSAVLLGLRARRTAQSAASVVSDSVAAKGCWVGLSGVPNR
jgi:hypothetical protein